MVSPRTTALRTLEQQIDPKHTALVVVDVQNDFVHPRGVAKRPEYKSYRADPSELWKETPLLPRMIERIPRILDSARRAGCLIVFVRGIYDPQYVSDSYAARLEIRDMYGNLCQFGTWGADFFGDIRPQEGPREVTITKHRYSAFWGTDLDLILRSNNIKTVVMTGVATSVCVESTTRDAFFNDYYVVMVDDACADYFQEAHDATLSIIRRSFGFVVSAADMVELWSGAGNVEAPAGSPQ